MHGRLIYCVIEGIKNMGLAVFLPTLEVLVRVATTRGPVAVTALHSTELCLAITDRLNIVVQIIEDFRFTIIKVPEEK